VKLVAAVHQVFNPFKVVCVYVCKPCLDHFFVRHVLRFLISLINDEQEQNKGTEIKEKY
jgi:hypothetical protein